MRVDNIRIHMHEKKIGHVARVALSSEHPGASECLSRLGSNFESGVSIPK